MHEDIRSGDHSTLATILPESRDMVILVSRDSGIIAGIEVAREVYKQFDEDISLLAYKSDGDRILPNDIVFEVEGKVRSLLSTERLVLNYIQRMSGIASYTNKLSQLIAGTETKLLDTRKTTPNMRLFEKWAVLIGGGQNHRFGLFDMIMLKDNHIDFAGGISGAVASTVKYLKDHRLNLQIEVETRNLEEVKQALETEHVDVIMLDNMDLITMKTALDLIAGRCKTEASGRITESNIREIALTGVDYISVGALTHSVNSLDLSLKAKN
ncbi:carboxylating nicotinate-nucleotide diphosphorylase [Bacteroidota bacterium]